MASRRAESSELFQAAFNGDLNRTHELLEVSTVDIEEGHYETKLSPLMGAACNGFDDVVELLLLYGADIFYKTPDGMTLLHFAASSGKANGRGTGFTMRVILEMAKTDARIDVNAISPDGETPLYRTLGSGTVDSMEQLLTFGVDTSLLNAEGKTCLQQMSGVGNLVKSEILIRYMANVDFQDKIGETALHKVASYGTQPPGSFIFARIPERCTIAQLLMEKGADHSLRNIQHQTAYDAAIRKGRPQVACVIKKEANRRATIEAVCMALHPRLGLQSRMSWLDPGVLQMILLGVDQLECDIGEGGGDDICE
jgi:ankyrin repeat protein